MDAAPGLSEPQGPPVKPKTAPNTYQLRHAQRWPLGTSYTKIIDQVCKVVGTGVLRGCTLVVDETGCGRPVCDMLRKDKPVGCRLVPITITAGLKATPSPDGQGFHVAKVQLVSAVHVLLQGRRLAWVKGDPTCEVLAKELLNFQMKVSAALNELYGSWREGTHDDLVLALAIAAWYAQQPRRQVICQ